ncbi:hypothetical protein [Rhodoblastus acidophilus]|uniref:hypothetical protein n=1 Tax=Rhodoblastus acidophilus TaxID=1074 RepID=UPI0013049993|nr:hypothetical protein [Rhodoblastus acidophilus]
MTPRDRQEAAPRPKSFDDWYRRNFERWGMPEPDEAELQKLWELNLQDETREHQ